MNLLSDLIEIQEGDTVSVVGSGGKTSFLYTLAEELKEKKVIVSTTTKMFIPLENFNYLYTENDRVLNGVNILIEEKLKDKFSTSIDLINYFKEKTDYMLLECDGAKMKPLKGWNLNEPVIPKFSDKTIGVIPVDILYKTINEELIHRIEEFLLISNAKRGDLITENIVKNVILHKNGLFKNSVGEKILFLNKVDNCNKEYLEKLVKVLPFSFLDKVIVGSLKNKEFRRIFK